MSKFLENLEDAVRKINRKLDHESKPSARAALKAERKKLENYIERVKA